MESVNQLQVQIQGENTNYSSFAALFFSLFCFSLLSSRCLRTCLCSQMWTRVYVAFKTFSRDKKKKKTNQWSLQKYYGTWNKYFLLLAARIKAVLMICVLLEGQLTGVDGGGGRRPLGPRGPAWPPSSHPLIKCRGRYAKRKVNVISW